MPEVDPHRHQQAGEAEAGPHELLEALGGRVGAIEVGPHARRRVDHHDADSGQRQHGKQERKRRLVPLAAHAAAAARGRVGRGGQRRGGHSRAPRASTRRPEGVAARGVVDEHVEAGGRRRQEADVAGLGERRRGGDRLVHRARALNRHPPVDERLQRRRRLPDEDRPRGRARRWRRRTRRSRGPCPFRRR